MLRKEASNVLYHVLRNELLIYCKKEIIFWWNLLYNLSMWGDGMEKLFEIITKELMVLFIAALPLVELRGAIPIGVSMGLSPIHATILGILGSLIPVPFLLFFLKPIFIKLRSTKLFRSTIDRIVRNTLKKSDKIKKYSIIGLIIFVAIPLPGTGVWSGSLAAILFNIRIKHAFPAIALGNAMAGVIMFILSHIVINI